MKVQLECMDKKCGAIVAGQDRYLDARRCPMCEGITLIKSFNLNDNHISYQEARKLWRNHAK